MFEDAREVARQASARNDELGLIDGQRVDGRKRRPWLVWAGIALGVAIIVFVMSIR